MPRPKRKGIPNAHGRPIKPINWDLVDELLLSGCDSTEIAPHFDMHPSTFCDRVLIEKGMLFTAYSFEKKAKGDSLLRHVQYKKALKGDNVQLIWLGKNRLGQRETTEVSVAPDTMKNYMGMMEQLNKMQAEREKGDESDESIANK